MAWTDPRDWTNGETVTKAIMDAHVRDNLKHIAGSAGFTGTPSATTGIEPVSGYFMGGAAQNWVVTGGTVNLTRNAGRTGSAAVSYGITFSSAPYVSCQPLGQNADGWDVSSKTTSGFTINDRSANEDTIAYDWMAIGVKSS